MIQAFQSVFTPINLRYIFQGLLTTLQIAVIAIILSILIGTILGLLRSYDKLILGKLAGIYIEVFRNTPNLLWVFICFIGAPLPTPVSRVCCAYVLFTSAMMAEIVRGGLNAIPQGQFEAAYSQGFTFFGTLWYIILPQCFKRIVPTMLSQVITVVKDTSFVAQVAIADLLYNTKNLSATLSVYSGHPITTSEIILLYGFAMLLYFAVNFTLSCIVRHMQKRNNTAAQTR